jgi:uncharacterized SAM-binding protein YcdF (DUF218 family)
MKWFILGVALLLFLAVFQAPAFLVISEAPVRADAVVLFVGGEKGSREKEADQLLREGFADYLIIPATGQIKKRGPDGRLESVHSEAKPQTFNLRPKTPARLENTHIEVYEAKRLMDNLGLHSALLVSSPYHMRRIKYITKSVFLDTGNVRTFKLYFVPTRYGTPHLKSWFPNIRDLTFVLMEYPKIFWFFIYSNFCRSTA